MSGGLALCKGLVSVPIDFFLPRLLCSRQTLTSNRCKILALEHGIYLCEVLFWEGFFNAFEVIVFSVSNVRMALSKAL